MSETKIYFKVFNWTNENHMFEYNYGLNTDFVPFDARECFPGGISVCRRENLCNYIGFGSLVGEITLPSDAKVCDYGDKLKADKIIISNVVPLENIPEWDLYEFCINAYNNDRQVAIKLGRNKLFRASYVENKSTFQIPKPLLKVINCPNLVSIPNTEIYF